MLRWWPWRRPSAWFVSRDPRRVREAQRRGPTSRRSSRSRPSLRCLRLRPMPRRSTSRRRRRRRRQLHRRPRPRRTASTRPPRHRATRATGAEACRPRDRRRTREIRRRWPPRHLEIDELLLGRMRSPSSLASCALASLLLIAPAARAQTAAAKPTTPTTPSAADLERSARDAYARREFTVAARGFEAAHGLAPHASLELNAGLAWEQAGDPARAADAYATALDAGTLDAGEAKMATSRREKLERALGTLTISGPAGASAHVDQERSLPLPLRAHVLPGRHLVQLAVDGAPSPAVTVTVNAGELRALTFGPAPPVAPVTAPAVATGARDPALHSAPVEPTSSGMSGPRIAGWSLLGLGACAAGAAIGLGVATLSAKSDYVDQHPSDVSRYDHVVTLRTATDVTWAIAGASAVAGLVLVLTSKREAPAAATTALHLVADGVAF